MVMTMPNIDNLKPRTTLSKEEAKEMGSKGGKASVKKRRERKAMKECFEMVLGLPLKDAKSREKIKNLGIKDKDINNQVAIIVSMVNEALKGNVKAYESIRDTIGERPTEKVENINPPVINIQRPK